ncbi:MAG: hypothetical protein FWB85_07870 [Chitinispirillia bacterium]|nr:hypothetical protein [Chitinispirillia bacterium]MCL2242182.1 hypothetical protein [Chitinispirillia bacterium]
MKMPKIVKKMSVPQRHEVIRLHPEDMAYIARQLDRLIEARSSQDNAHLNRPMSLKAVAEAIGISVGTLYHTPGIPSKRFGRGKRRWYTIAEVRAYMDRHGTSRRGK